MEETSSTEISVGPPNVKCDDTTPKEYEIAVEKLATSVLAAHLPHLQHGKEQIAQLNENQRVLIETIQQENGKFGDCQLLTDTSDLMEKAKVYHDKLLKIKREMFILHDKSAKLKKRALKIQQERMKEELQREHQREKELERERQLMAQPASKAKNASKKTEENTK